MRLRASSSFSRQMKMHTFGALHVQYKKPFGRAWHSMVERGMKSKWRKKSNNCRLNRKSHSVCEEKVGECFFMHVNWCETHHHYPKQLFNRFYKTQRNRSKTSTPWCSTQLDHFCSCFVLYCNQAEVVVVVDSNLFMEIDGEMIYYTIWLYIKLCAIW